MDASTAFYHQPSTAQKNPAQYGNLTHFDCQQTDHSAVAAMGMLLHHHRIGWNHIPKTENNTPENQAFMAMVAGWLRTPAQCSASHLLQSLERAGLQAKGFSTGCVQTLSHLLQTELSQQRPVLALTQGNPANNEPHAVWRVLYHFNPANQSIHTHNPFNAMQRLIWGVDEWLQKLTGHPGNTSAQKTELHYTVLTAYKPDPNPPKLFSNPHQHKN